MEVASPLAIASNSNKRSLLIGNDDDIVMDVGRSVKRHRCNGSAGFSSPIQIEPSWAQQQLQHQQKLVAEMRKMIDEQNKLVTKLKTENELKEQSLSQLNTAHEKVVGENRILKKAVSIQQERQNQAAQQVHILHREKEEASDRIRRLEQMNLQLRFLVERASQPSEPHGFMGGFGQPPPDIY